MSRLAYSRASVVADVLRAGAGVLLTGTPLVAADPARWLAVLLGALLVLFTAYLWHTLSRLRQRFDLQDEALHVVPGNITITWSDLDEMHLDYFSTRRDGRAGWMQLRLRAGDQSVRVDSGLMQFQSLLERAVRAARERELELTPTTAANLAEVESIMGRAE